MKAKSEKGAATGNAVAAARRAAEARVNAERRRTTVTWIVAGVIVVGLLSALVAFIVRQGAVDDAPPPGAAGTPTVSVGGGFGVGSSGVVGENLDAHHVKLDVYFDFMCPACGAFEQTQSAMLDELRTAGTVDVYYHPLAFLDTQSSGTKYSTRAASAAVLVAEESPDSFVAFVESLFANQPSEGTTGLSDKEIQSLASAAGVPDAIVSRIPDHEYAAWVRSESEAASKAGVRYTPTLGFNGELQDPSDQASVQWSQDGALRQAIVDLGAK